MTAPVTPNLDPSPSSAVADDVEATWFNNLLTLYDNDGALKWIASPHALLNDITPLQTIRNGKEADVAKVVDQLISGAYL